MQLSSSCVSSGKDRNGKILVKALVWYIQPSVISGLWSLPQPGASIPPNLTVHSERVTHEGQKCLLNQGDHLVQF